MWIFYMIAIKIMLEQVFKPERIIRAHYTIAIKIMLEQVFKPERIIQAH